MFRDTVNDQLTLDPFEEADEESDEKELDVVERDAAMGLHELEMMSHDRKSQDSVATRAVAMLGNDQNGNAEAGAPRQSTYPPQGGPNQWAQAQAQSAIQSFRRPSPYDIPSNAGGGGGGGDSFQNFDTELPLDMQTTLQGLPQLSDPMPDAFSLTER